MKILIVHYAYWVTGGPERYLFNVKEALEKIGHEVIPFSMNCRENQETPYARYFISPINPDGSWYFNRNVGGFRPFFKQTGRLFHSIEARRKLRQLIRKEAPDIAYVMLYHKKLSPDVLSVCRSLNLPMVMRMSDYLPMCPKMTFYRAGKICERCRKSKVYSVWYRCTRNSFFASLLWYLADKYHHARGIYGWPDAVVVTNPFMKQKMRDYGYQGRYEVIASPCGTTEGVPRSFAVKIRSRQFCYVGNIFEHKGVDLLLHGFQLFRQTYPEYRLVILGNDYDHLLSKRMTAEPSLFEHVDYRGVADRQTVLEVLSCSLYSVVPVKWYENLPNAIIESYAVGTPVIATDIGSIPYAVRHRHTGFTFAYGDETDLARTMGMGVNQSENSYGRLQDNCLAKARTRYSNETHCNKLISVFQSLIRQKKSRCPHGETADA